MATFKDRDGREWVVEFDVPTIERIKERHDLNLVDLSDGQSSPWLKLMTDPTLVCRTAWTICEQQATDAGVSPEQFGRALVGNAIDDAFDAIQGGMADFFPRHQRRLLCCLVQTLRKMTDAATDQVIAKLSDQRTMDTVTANLARAMDERIKRLQTSSESATNTRGY